MTSIGPSAPAGMMLGYARAGTDASSADSTLESQIDALVEGGVPPARVYTDQTRAGAPDAPRPGFDALLDYARAGDTVVVIGIDRLGRTTPEVLSTLRLLAARELGVRALRERLTTADDAGAMIVGVLASLAVVDEEAHAARGRARIRAPGHGGPSLGRPRVLTDDQVELAKRMRAKGDPVPTIAATLGVSRATLYRTLAEKRTTR
ncbi:MULTISPECIES: recombinase family protein [unclassified Gordonia (in: high G+C Gram-positive bacteria)]